MLKSLQGASDDLYAWAATRVANQPDITINALMVQHGLGELAAEASKILEQHGEQKAGNSRRCVIGDTIWEPGGKGPGKCPVTIDQKVWTMYDFKEEIFMTEELAGLLGVVQPENEKRQCVTKVLAAGYLLNELHRLPTMDEVEALGQEFRLEQARQAAEAEAAMGHAEPKVSAVEHELRMYAHDILKAHHDKDYRSVAVYPLEQLGNHRIVVFRVDYKGDVLPEVVMGTQWRQGQPTIWTMVCKGHMTLLVPPSQDAGQHLVQLSDVYVTPCLGFPYFWHQRHDQARTAPGVLARRHCKPSKRANTWEVEGLLRRTTRSPSRCFTW